MFDVSLYLFFSILLSTSSQSFLCHQWQQIYFNFKQKELTSLMRKGFSDVCENSFSSYQILMRVNISVHFTLHTNDKFAF
jgi:hypothetical protein